jgi:hypothetical protein
MSKTAKVAKKPVVSKGFDRGVDYLPMKNKLIKKFDERSSKFLKKDFFLKAGYAVTYLMIAMIQLRNGSRVGEAIAAFHEFYNEGYTEKAVVKIEKSDRKFTDKDGNPITKCRYRHMIFPINWFDAEIFDKVFAKLSKTHDKFIKTKINRHRILDFMQYHFSVNTHSLRYAFINYMLYVHNRPANDVAKFVGHTNTNQIVTYTQRKNCDQIFDLDI